MIKKATLYPTKDLLRKDDEEGSMDYLLTPYGLMLLRTLGQALHRPDRILMPVQTDAINISLVTSGEAVLIVNQHEIHLSRGCLLLKTTESIIQLQSHSYDYDMQILDVSDEFVSDITQGHVPPALAAIIMSLESVFGALAGWIFLGDVLTARQLVGCGLVLAAVVFTEVCGAVRKPTG